MLKRAIATVLVVLAVVLSGLVVATPAYAHPDHNCDDFPSQKAAQLHFLKSGGPAYDPDGLDRDGDGIVCEWNDAPYYYSTSLPAPKPRSSSVRLSVSATKRIAGEPLRLTARVAPHKARRVVLQRLGSFGWVRVKGGKTTKKGVFTYRTRTRSASTSYRAYVPGAKLSGHRYASATSSRRTVRTQAQSVTLSMPTLSGVTGSKRASVRVSPTRAGRPVALLVRRVGAAAWTTSARARLTHAGRAAFTIKPRRGGSFDYRAVVLRSRGAASRSSAARTLEVLARPAAPKGLTVTPSDGSAYLSWNAGSGQDVRYRVYRRKGSGAWTEVEETGGTNGLATGLTNGTTYAFAVTQVDEVGQESTKSQAVSGTPVAADAAPQPPKGLQATAGDASAELAWDASPESDVVAYKIFRVDQAAGTSTVLGQQSGTSFHVAGLTNGEQAWFAVAAIDAGGQESAWSGVVTTTPVAAGP